LESYSESTIILKSEIQTIQDEKPAPKGDVVAFFHSYARDGELGSYFNELIRAFVNSGVRLHLILANTLVDTLGATRLRTGVSEKKIINYIREVNPAFVFTTNHAGITYPIMEGISCPILTWMVDRTPFLHHGKSSDKSFCEKDIVISASQKNVARLQTIWPILKGRVHWLPFATNYKTFDVLFPEKDINISFVGSYFSDAPIRNILEAYREKPKVVQNFMKLAQDIRDNYDLDLDHLIEKYHLQEILTHFKMDSYRLKGFLANNISNNKRLKCLDAVSDLGLVLFGTENWLEVSSFSLDLVRCYNSTFIKTREQLVEVYQRSKIAINIEHHAAVDGLPYRIFDIMASQALLISNYREDSDLYKLFGRDMPIPLYKNPSDLRRLVQHYLDHEDERLAIVKRCNQLIAEGFSFNYRIQQFFEILHLPQPNSAEGELIRIAQNHFDRSLPAILLTKGSSLFVYTFKWPIRILYILILSFLSSHRSSAVLNFIKLIIPYNLKIKIIDCLQNNNFKSLDHVKKLNSFLKGLGLKTKRRL